MRDRQTSSAKIIVKAMMKLFDRMVNPNPLVRRMYVVANHLIDEAKAAVSATNEQSDLFDCEILARQEAAETANLEKGKTPPACRT